MQRRHKNTIPYTNRINNPYVVLLEKLLGEPGAHTASAVHRGGGEVRLAHLPPGGGLIGIKFH
jgi:hypothetical protein